MQPSGRTGPCRVRRSRTEVQPAIGSKRVSFCAGWRGSASLLRAASSTAPVTTAATQSPPVATAGFSTPATGAGLARGMGLTEAPLEPLQAVKHRSVGSKHLVLELRLEELWPFSSSGRYGHVCPRELKRFRERQAAPDLVGARQLFHGERIAGLLDEFPAWCLVGIDDDDSLLRASRSAARRSARPARACRRRPRRPRARRAKGRRRARSRYRYAPAPSRRSSGGRAPCRRCRGVSTPSRRGFVPLRRGLRRSRMPSALAGRARARLRARRGARRARRARRATCRRLPSRRVGCWMWRACEKLSLAAASSPMFASIIPVTVAPMASPQGNPISAPRSTALPRRGEARLRGRASSTRVRGRTLRCRARGRRLPRLRSRTRRPIR